MKTYKMPAEGLKQAKRDYLRKAGRNGWILAFVLAAGFTAMQDRSQGPIPLSTYAMIFAFLFLVWGLGSQFVIRFRLPQIENVWGNFHIMLREQLIAAQQPPRDEVVIRNNEIKSIEEARTGDIVIKGQQAGQVIIVPAKIEGYSEIRAQINEWHPIVQGVKPTQDFYLSIAFTAFLLLSIVVRVTTNPIIVFPLGAIALGGIGYIAHRLLSRPDVKGRARWGTIGLSLLGGLSALLQMALVGLLMARGQ